MKVLVTGGTGVLGREVASRLRERGAEVVVLSRRSGEGRLRGDLETGDGIAEALAGVDVVAHCASGADWSHPQKDVVQTRNLLAAAAATRPHVVYISIVGVDRIRLGYYRAKYACERMISSSGLPWTVQRATQFHELVLMLAMMLTKGPVAIAPRGMRSQPVDTGEVADRLADLVLGPPAGRVTDFGGPRMEEVSAMIRQYLAATGRRKPVLRIPLVGRIARDFRAGHHLLGPGAQRGHRTFADFLAARAAQAGGAIPAPYDLSNRKR